MLYLVFLNTIYTTYAPYFEKPHHKAIIVSKIDSKSDHIDITHTDITTQPHKETKDIMTKTKNNKITHGPIPTPTSTSTPTSRVNPSRQHSVQNMKHTTIVTRSHNEPQQVYTKTSSTPVYDVNIDFDEAHDAWMQNKRQLNDCTYTYICGKMTKKGSRCLKGPTCRLHSKL